MPGIVPKLSDTPARSARRARGDRADNEEVYGELGLSPEELASLRAKGNLVVISHQS